MYSVSEQLGLASMHTADSGCRLEMIGALGAVMSVWWTLSDTMLFSVGAGLMSVGGLIGLFVGAHSVDVFDERNLCMTR